MISKGEFIKKLQDLGWTPEQIKEKTNQLYKRPMGKRAQESMVDYPLFITCRISKEMNNQIERYRHTEPQSRKSDAIRYILKDWLEDWERKQKEILNLRIRENLDGK